MGLFSGGDSKHTVKHRKTVGGYLMDSLKEADRREHEKQMLKKQMKEMRSPKDTPCDNCGSIGISAKCSGKKTFGKCDKALCEDCVYVCEDCGKKFCSKHGKSHKCK